MLNGTIGASIVQQDGCMGFVRLPGCPADRENLITGADDGDLHHEAVAARST